MNIFFCSFYSALFEHGYYSNLNNQVEDVEESELKPPGLETEEIKDTSDSTKNKSSVIDKAVQSQNISDTTVKENEAEKEKSSDDIDMFACDSPKINLKVPTTKVDESNELIKLQKSRKESAKLMKCLLNFYFYTKFLLQTKVQNIL